MNENIPLNISKSKNGKPLTISDYFVNVRRMVQNSQKESNKNIPFIIIDSISSQSEIKDDKNKK